MSRYSLQLSENQEKIIARLVEICGLKKGEILTEGLTLLSWAAVEASKGRLIAAIDENEKVYKQVETTALLAARNNSSSGQSKRQSRTATA